MINVTAWLLLAYGSDRLYGGNLGYDDRPGSSYQYDSYVSNHKQLSVGDLVVVASKDSVVGVSVVSEIESESGVKEFQRCPVCKVTQSKRRKTKTPVFRCTNGHEFDEPELDAQPCTLFTAHYGDPFIPTPAITIGEIRNVCDRFSGQLSIQRLNLNRLVHLLDSVPDARNFMSDLILGQSHRQLPAIDSPWQRLVDLAAGLPDSGADDSDGVVEGRRVLRIHYALERNPGLVRTKKRRVMAEFGCLQCECCEFDFASIYGPLGDGFIECHHKTPLSEISGSTVTRLADLSLLCANCHRILHRNPTETVETLRLRLAAV